MPQTPSRGRKRTTNSETEKVCLKGHAEVLAENSCRQFQGSRAVAAFQMVSAGATQVRA